VESASDKVFWVTGGERVNDALSVGERAEFAIVPSWLGLLVLLLGIFPVEHKGGFRSVACKTQAHAHVFRFEIDPFRVCTSLERTVTPPIVLFTVAIFSLFFHAPGRESEIRPALH
jgi:hypothetical protein